MDTGINFDCVKITDVKSGVKRLIRNGFTYSFLNAEDPLLLRFCSEIKGTPLKAATLHAPFESNGYSYINDMWKDGDKGDDMLKRLIISVESCAKYDIPVLVTHLSSGENAPVVNDTGFERFYRLMSRANELGVTVAFENQRKISNLACALEYFPKAKFCLDLGHEYCFTDGKDFLSLFGDKLVTVHVHDNLKTRNGDLHWIPYDGAIDYNRFLTSLAAVGYDGVMMLEVFKTQDDKSRVNPLYSTLTDDGYIARARLAANRLRNAYSGIVKK